MSRAKLVILVIALIAILSFYSIFVGNPFSKPHAIASQQYQVLFVGENGNQTQAGKNSTIIGSFQLNMTQPSQLKFTLGEEKYYPPGSVGNNTTPFTYVDTFQNGSISFNSATYILGTLRDCTATAGLTQTMGNTIRIEATCNASTISPQIGTWISVTSAGISQFGYSVFVPASAMAGTYLVNIVVQGQSMNNFAVQSGNLMYVLTIIVSN